MRRFHDLSIQSKLMVLLLLTSFSGLLLVAVAIGLYEVGRVRHSMVQELSLQAELVAAASAAALATEDAVAAQHILESLRLQPGITQARLFTTAGTLLASYTRAKAPPARPLAPPRQIEGHRFADGYLEVNRPCQLGADQVGTVSLRVDLQEQRARLRAYASIGVVAIFLALLVALLLSLRLQNLVTRPILSLSRLAQEVTQRHDYSLRAAKQTEDEVGLLVENINRMLAHIQRSDAALRESEQRFREVTESIREVFWMYDWEHHRLLYVSPSYEEVWGRTSDSLYARPEEWLAAVHPDDQERILEAFMTQANRGEYDEEYRIVRLDGAIRWIHDRGFPVPHAHSPVQRVVGIAEDITQRKQLEAEILRISEHERTRIGQDLHDGVCQQLIRIAFTSNQLQRDLAARAQPEAAAAQRICTLLDGAILQARQLARGLYPVKLAGDGLAAALADLAREAHQNSGRECVLDCPQAVQVHNQTVATHLYRIAQEAVNNALKHSEAKHIEIGLRADPNTLHLTVADDGIGIPEKRTRHGMGLHIMSYRVRLLGGRLTLRRGAHGGTIAQCSLPRKMLS